MPTAALAIDVKRNTLDEKLNDPDCMIRLRKATNKIISQEHRQELDDILNEAICRMYRYIHSVKDLSKLENWMKSVIRNTFLSTFRIHKELQYTILYSNDSKNDIYCVRRYTAIKEPSTELPERFEFNDDKASKIWSNRNSFLSKGQVKAIEMKMSGMRLKEMTYPQKQQCVRAQNKLRKRYHAV